MQGAGGVGLLPRVSRPECVPWSSPVTRRCRALWAHGDSRWPGPSDAATSPFLPSLLLGLLGQRAAATLRIISHCLSTLLPLCHGRQHNPRFRSRDAHIFWGHRGLGDSTAGAQWGVLWYSQRVAGMRNLGFIHQLGPGRVPPCVRVSPQDC